MLRRKPFILIALIMSLLILSLACDFSVIQTPAAPVDMNAVSTSAALTVESRFTQSALETIMATVTELSPTTTLTTLFSATPSLTSTPATPSRTPLTPTATRTPTPLYTATNTPPAFVITYVTPTPTASPIPCNWVRFVEDITIPDGSSFNPGQTFIKTWRLQNIGSCTWTNDYELVLSSGDAMGGTTAQKLNRTVNPGDIVDLSVTLTAPTSSGSHMSYWMLRSTDGIVFGWGASQSKSFWASIVVSTLPTVSPDTPLDMADAYCNARWSNNGGTILSCPSQTYNYTTGSVTRTDSPDIEIGYNDDEATLITIPSDGVGGSISGHYPAVTVKSGDRFTALGGCLDSSPNCSVTFLLKYTEKGGTGVQTIASWDETYDGNRSQMNVDLNSLAGKSVEFILEVQNRNDSSSDDRAFWMVPRVGQ